MKPFVCLLSVLILSSTGAVHADKIYRWTDANGQVHFGSQPPMDRKAKSEEVNLKVKPTASELADIQKNSGTDDDDFASILTNPTTNAPVPQAKPQRMDASEADAICNEAKRKQNDRAEIYVKRVQQPDGTFRPMNEEERAEYLRKIDMTIAQYCS